MVLAVLVGLAGKNDVDLDGQFITVCVPSKLRCTERPFSGKRAGRVATCDRDRQDEGDQPPPRAMSVFVRFAIFMGDSSSMW